MTVLTAKVVHLPLSLNDTIEQQIVHSVLWQCWLGGWGGPSAFGVFTFIYALVFPYIFLLNSEEITLCYDSVDQGDLSAFHISMYFGLNDTIEQWIDHFVLWQYWLGGCPSAFDICTFIYALLFPYIFLLNSEEITLCSGSVD